MIEEITRVNVVRVSFVGEATSATCVFCGHSIEIKQSCEFVPIKETHAGKTVIFKTNKTYLKNFIEIHYGKHKREQDNKNARR